MSEPKQAKITMSSLSPALRQIPLFAACSDDIIDALSAHADVTELRSGDTVCRTGEPLGALILVLRGKLTISASRGMQGAVLRTIPSPGILGLSTLFGENQAAVSTVRAAGKASIARVERTVFCDLLRRDSELALRCIEYLSSRVRFLNARIETFTAPSAEARLANYLLSLPAAQGEVTLPVSCRALSEMLNVGRASLYRAFDTLEEQGMTVRQGKTVLIKDADAMRNAFFA